MNHALHLGAALALLACLTSGCQPFTRAHLAKYGHSPLKPAQSSPDSIAVNIVWARFPANDPVLDDSAWREIDETQIDPDVRRELVANGIRAGVISGTIPPAIDRILNQDGLRAPTSVIDEPSAPSKSQSAELLAEPIVHGRTMRLRRKQRTEIQASEVYASMPLLINTSSGAELGGHTYEQAQAIYALRVEPQSDRTTLVELTPELQHGASRLRYTGGEDGILRQASLKEREVFDRLRVSVKIGAGEMLVLMSLPDAGSRLGHYFHTVDTADGPQQKLILIRLAEVPRSDTFAAVAE
jgi:hypothetical protein